MPGAGIGLFQVASRGGGVFSPLSLFASGEEGAWYDPSDLTTLFQDAAGTTPVTADSQPVRLMLDKSKGGVGTNGALAYNRIVFSEDFDNAALVKNNSTVTSDATTDPLGGTSADKMVATAVSNLHQVTDVLAITNGAVYTLSVYAKQAEWKYVYLDTFQAASATAMFDLDLGVVSGTSGSPTSTAIVSVGNGWYRCSMTFTATAGGSIFGYSIGTSGNGNVNLISLGDGTSGIYVWGAQLEIASAATTYQPITASWAATMPGNHATAPSDAARPLYRTAGGLHWLEFDGVDDSLSATFVMVNPITSAFAGKTTLYLFDAPANPRLRMESAVGTNQVTAIAAAGLVFPAANLVATKGIARSTVNGASSSISVNGAANVTGDTGAGGSGGVRFAANRFLNVWAAVDIYQSVFVARSLSAGEEAQLDAFLAEKSGVTL